jgi:hypothetical protein
LFLEALLLRKFTRNALVKDRSKFQTLFPICLQKKDYGKVPTYLTKVKDQVKREKEHIENITQKMMHVSLTGSFCYVLVCFSFKKWSLEGLEEPFFISVQT